jgi:hypothetical protein
MVIFLEVHSPFLVGLTMTEANISSAGLGGYHLAAPALYYAGPQDIP